jgi:hypothetical protein
MMDCPDCDSEAFRSILAHNGKSTLLCECCGGEETLEAEEPKLKGQYENRPFTVLCTVCFKPLKAVLMNSEVALCCIEHGIQATAEY